MNKELDDFLHFNSIDKNNGSVDEEDTSEIEKFIISDYPSIYSILKSNGGKSFENGLFRIHTFGSSATWSNFIREYFPEFEKNIYCFGYDWMGCMYCFSSDEEPTIYIFDPADMDTREAEATIIDFFNVDLVKYRDDTLLYGRFKKLRKLLQLNILDVDKCLGYEESLFLGGEDIDANFGIFDIEVYWELQQKIFQKIQDLPDGAEVGDIIMED